MFTLRSATCFGETLQMRYIPETKTSCIKDMGEKTSHQKWSRGTFFFVSMEVDISTCGNHFTSKISTAKVHLVR